MKPAENEKKSEDTPSILKALLVVLVVILLPIIVIVGLLYFVWGLILSTAIWIVWGMRSRYILFVYSNSPTWEEYIQREILPHIQEKAVILNWSERKKWKPSLAVWAFRFFGGRRNFNPMAIVFRPFRLHKTFRFYEAFQEYKHGRTQKLNSLKAEFLNFIST